MPNATFNNVPELSAGDVYFGGAKDCCPRCDSTNVEERTFYSSWEVTGVFCNDCEYRWCPASNE